MARRFTISDWQERLNKLDQPVIIVGKHNIANSRKEIFTIRCFKCGGTFKADRKALHTACLMREHGKPIVNWCPICNGHMIAKGINDIATLRKDLIKYFDNPEDAEKCSIGCHTRVKLRCPKCNQTKTLAASDLCAKGFHCDYCSDNISLGNKILRNLVIQLPVEEYEFEFSSTWSNNKRYDGYFKYKDNKYLIEMDGEQHVKNTSWSPSSFQKDNDEIKNQLALDNGYALIRIKAYKTDFEYIKTNILSSKLADLFDLSCVDWETIYDKTVTSINIEMGKYYMEHKEMMLKDIAQHFNISTPTLTKTLKKLTNIGLCDYSKNESFKNGRIQSGKIKTKDNVPFTVYSPLGNNIGVFKTSKDCFRFLSEKYKEIHFDERQIRQALFTGTKHKGYRFVYENGLYNYHKTNNPQIFDIYNLYDNGMSVKEISTETNLSTTTIYKYIETVKRLEAV